MRGGGVARCRSDKVPYYVQYIHTTHILLMKGGAIFPFVDD